MLRRCRLDHGLSLRALAERLGVYHFAVFDSEQHANVHFDTMMGVAEACGISFLEMVRRYGDRSADDVEIPRRERPKKRPR